MRLSLVPPPARVIRAHQASIRRKSPPHDYVGGFKVVPDDCVLLSHSFH